MDKLQQWMPASDALTVARVLVKIEEQIWRAWKEDRGEDARSLAGLVGRLRVRIFEMSDAGVWVGCCVTVFDQMRDEYDFDAEVEQQPEPEYRGPDVDAAYERSVDEEMGCM